MVLVPAIAVYQVSFRDLFQPCVPPKTTFCNAIVPIERVALSVLIPINLFPFFLFVHLRTKVGIREQCNPPF